MKKLLLLALIACATLSCSKDNKEDNTVRYEEIGGYATNLASAKHGIDGTWKTEGGYDYRGFNATLEETCSWSSNPGLDPNKNCYPYKITKEGNSYYLNTFSKDTGKEFAKYRIGILNKTQLSLLRTDTGAGMIHYRTSTPPTP